MLTDMKILHRLGLKSSPNHCAAVATKDATPGQGRFAIVLPQPRVHSFGRCVPMQWLAWWWGDDANSPPTHTDLHGLADCRAWPPLGKSPGAGAARCGPRQNLTILAPQTMLPHLTPTPQYPQNHPTTPPQRPKNGPPRGPRRPRALHCCRPGPGQPPQLCPHHLRSGAQRGGAARPGAAGGGPAGPNRQTPFQPPPPPTSAPPPVERAPGAAAPPGRARLALAGLAVSVKDLFDIAGQTTSAGSTALADAPPAARDCVAVARLRADGASIIGRSKMTEFACSGVGVNPHFGTPAAWDARSGALPGAPRVPGGSSSGAGVSVATGAAFIGLGSDTGGSIRVPAAVNGIVGFKNTARLVPTTGAIPLSHSLDTACALTRSVRDAIVAHEVLAARHVARSQAPLSEYRLALVSTWFLDDMDATVARAHEPHTTPRPPHWERRPRPPSAALPPCFCPPRSHSSPPSPLMGPPPMASMQRKTPRAM